jgi:hypothetical protein
MPNHSDPDLEAPAWKESLFLSVMTLGEICKGTLVTVLMTSDFGPRTSDLFVPPKSLRDIADPQEQGPAPTRHL